MASIPDPPDDWPRPTRAQLHQAALEQATNPEPIERRTRPGRVSAIIMGEHVELHVHGVGGHVLASCWTPADPFNPKTERDIAWLVEQTGVDRRDLLREVWRAFILLAAA